MKSPMSVTLFSAVFTLACAHAPPAEQPRLELVAPARAEGHAGGHVWLDLALRNAGPKPATVVVTTDPSVLKLAVLRDSDGAPAPCGRPKRPPAVTDTRREQTLEPGAAAKLRADLFDFCPLDVVDVYRVTATYETGRGTAGPVTFKALVSGPVREWQNPGPLSPGQGPYAPPKAPSMGAPPGASAAALRACVDAELARRGLNTYGDPPGTMYPGGTPLFDMVTGKRTDRYEYVLAHHAGIRTACGAGEPGTPR